MSATPSSSPSASPSLPPGNANTPAIAGDFTAGWDPASQRVILEQWGPDGTSTPVTWAWDGRRWSTLSPQHQLPPQREASMAVDPVSHRLLLMGGTSLSNGNNGQPPAWGPNDGTWLWTGSDWTRTGDNPKQGGHPALAVDAATGELLANCPDILGIETPSGISEGAPTLPSPPPSWAGSGSFRWTGADWTAAGGTASLLLRAGIGYDPVSRRVIQFGGNSQGSGDTTSAYDGAWSMLQPAHTPPRGPAAAATDMKAGTLVMLAGSADRPGLATTWTWSGSDWHRLIVPEPPSDAAYGAQMVWDPALAHIVLLDAVGQDPSPLQVWLWMGVDQGWQLLPG